MLDVASTTYDEEIESIFKTVEGTRSRSSQTQRSNCSAKVVYITSATSNFSGQIADGSPSSYDAALARLRSFRCWGENWDGEHADAPDHDLINTAINALSLLEITHVPIVVHLDANSRPMFFIRESDWRGEIMIEEQDRLSFEFRRHGDILDVYDLDFDGKSLPIPLVEAIDRIAKVAPEL